MHWYQLVRKMASAEWGSLSAAQDSSGEDVASRWGSLDEGLVACVCKDPWNILSADNEMQS